MRLSHKDRLYPTEAQDAALTGMLGAFCDLYNAALDQRLHAYRRRGVTPRYGQQAGELTAVRATDGRLAAYSSSAEQRVLRRLDKAFAAFFRRLKAGGKPGFPRFRAKARFDSAEFRVGDGLTIRQTERLGLVGIPGEVKVKWHRDLPPDAKLAAAVVSRSRGTWFVCFRIEVPDAAPAERPFAPVGVDMGLSSLVALSTGETGPAPRWPGQAARAPRRAQRAAARTRRDSRRRREAKLRVARLHARVANRRRDFSHQLSRSLVDRFTHLAFEDLNVAGLARGRLATSVHDAAWTQLVDDAIDKAAWAGGTVSLVDPRGTSQTCPRCGTAAAKALAQGEHRCDCGCVLDRDVAAARIVLQRAGFSPGTGLRARSEPVAAWLAREAARFSWRSVHQRDLHPVPVDQAPRNLCADCC
jgi:putative transposase